MVCTAHAGTNEESDQNPPELSIIVPAYQAASTLEACLRALSRQETLFRYELIVVENASSDETLTLARRLESEFPHLLRVLVETQKGSYAARNRGLQAAEGRLLLFTDADCIPSPQWADRLATALLPEGVLLVGGEIEGDPAQAGLLARYARQAGILSAAGALSHRRAPFAQTANLGVRREDALEIGGFDGGLFSGGDADFCWRLSERFPDRRLEFSPDAKVYHHHRESLSELWRQFYRYGQGDRVQARRRGVQYRRLILGLVADLVRFIFWPFMSLLQLPRALLDRDLLPLLRPPLRVFRALARRSGQVSLLLRPKKLRRR